MSNAPTWRVQLVVAVMGLLWVALGVRLVLLQGIAPSRWEVRAERQRETVETTPARPGDILDRHGRLLATTVAEPSFFVVPCKIQDLATFSRQLAEVVGGDSVSWSEKIASRANKHFMWIKRRLDPDEASRVRAANLPRGTWGLRDDYRRVYPLGSLAAHVVGLRDIDGAGHGGIEQAWNAVLIGTPGRRKIWRDARGRVIDVDSDEVPPQPGRAVWLTVDSLLQIDVERVLDDVMATWKPENCCAIVLDPRSGEVLSMASRPTFDPNHPELAAADSWKNRVIADLYEPGSTLKPMIVAAALDRGVIERNQKIDCERGLYRMGPRLLHDHHRYGTLSLTDVLVKSSNIGMAKVGQALTNDGLYDAVCSFGFGRVTGIELPGELSGQLRPLDRWNGYSTGSIPMGHEISTTPLQLLTAHAALAAGGVWRRPTIVMASNDEPAQRTSHQAASPEHCDWLVRGPLTEVVTRGTGRRARLSEVAVFGKTGTAQVLGDDGQYRHDRYVSSFVCGAPADAPRVLVLVVVNEATVGQAAFGGSVAAPAAAEILSAALAAVPVQFAIESGHRIAR